MKISGIIYFFTPLESDMKNRKELREHLASPTAGRLFLQKSEHVQWTIPFASICHLMKILNDVRSKEASELDFTIDNRPCKSTIEKDVRRCFRVRIEDINAEYHPRRYLSFLGKSAKDGFSDESTGLLVYLDLDEEHKHYKMFFTDFFDAGTKLNKAFSKEVRRRIKVEEEVNIPYDVED